jgi:Kef-type K+ transport system membrane component KefB
MEFIKFRKFCYSLISLSILGWGFTAIAYGAEGSHNNHADPFSAIIFVLGIIILVAMMGRHFAISFHQPSVVGELVAGILLGNILYWFGSPIATLIMNLSSVGEIFKLVWSHHVSYIEAARMVFTAEELAHGVGQQIVSVLKMNNSVQYVLMAIALWMFSNIGVIMLLFMTGLETSVQQMLEVGPRAVLVGLIGVIVPFLLGFFTIIWLIPSASTNLGLLIGATLSATSVGITARVLEDMGKLSLPESKMILGAAVIDDILGLIVLAIVVGIITTGQFQLMVVLKIIVLSVLFLTIVILFGERLIRRLIHLIGQLDRSKLKVLFPVTFAFAMAWFADKIGLASIIGAFAAGLILCDSEFAGETDEPETVEELIKPFEVVFAPVFFVLMGMQVNLSSFMSIKTLMLAGILIVIAIIGKIISGFAAGRNMNSWIVGIGMIPRGEVGLIFASIGKGMGVFSDATFSAIILMVIVTTLIAPIGLQWSFSRYRKV